MNLHMKVSDGLAHMLENVREMHHRHLSDEFEFRKKHGIHDIALDTSLIDKIIDSALPHLSLFTQEHHDRSPVELADLANKLSPGRTHDAGTLARLVYDHMRGFVSDILLAATIYHNWGCGKVGFQFLPLPHTYDPDEYSYDAWELIEFLRDATDCDPLRLLVGDDRAFYETLPDRIRVYRGAAGIEPELAAQGVCWSIDRRYAEWFASRSRHYGEPLLVAAWVKKADIALALADEGEVVCQPHRWTQLKCRPQTDRPPSPFVANMVDG